MAGDQQPDNRNASLVEEEAVTYKKKAKKKSKVER